MVITWVYGVNWEDRVNEVNVVNAVNFGVWYEWMWIALANLVNEVIGVSRMHGVNWMHGLNWANEENWAVSYTHLTLPTKRIV